jgi:hypothetical protein
MLKHCASNRKRWLSALPNVGPYIYVTTLKFLALQGAPCIYDIGRLRVKRTSTMCVTLEQWILDSKGCDFLQGTVTVCACEGLGNVRIAGLRDWVTSDCPKLASEKHPLHLKQWSRPGLNALKACSLYQNLETPYILKFFLIESIPLCSKFSVYLYNPSNTTK